jgi:hypothetical protein
MDNQKYYELLESYFMEDMNEKDSKKLLSCLDEDDVNIKEFIRNNFDLNYLSGGLKQQGDTIPFISPTSKSNTKKIRMCEDDLSRIAAAGKKIKIEQNDLNAIKGSKNKKGNYDE